MEFSVTVDDSFEYERRKDMYDIIVPECQGESQVITVLFYLFTDTVKSVHVVSQGEYIV